jgi:hypothetical protein
MWTEFEPTSIAARRMMKAYVARAPLSASRSLITSQLQGVAGEVVESAGYTPAPFQVATAGA